MRRFLYTILISILIFTGCSSQNNDNAQQTYVPDLKDDFYESVNYTRLAGWVIPENGKK